MVEEKEVKKEDVQKGTEQTEIHSFKDTGVGTIFEGVEKAELKNIMNTELVIKEFAELPSKFGETFFVVLAEKEGKPITFPVGSSVLKHQLKELKEKEKLPCKVKIVEKQSKDSGRTYQTFE